MITKGATMSITTEPDMYYWPMYLEECKATHTTPDIGDYMVWLNDMDMDRKEDYEREYNDAD